MTGNGEDAKTRERVARLRETEADVITARGELARLEKQTGGTIRERLRRRVQRRSLRLAIRAGSLSVKLRGDPEAQAKARQKSQQAADAQWQAAQADLDDARKHLKQSVESEDLARHHLHAALLAWDREADEHGRLRLARVLQALAGWLLVALFLLGDYWLFRVFDASYFSWYLNNGSLIGLVFAFIALAISLDRFPDLISSNPARYLIANLGLWQFARVGWRTPFLVKPDKTASWWLPMVFDRVISFILYRLVFFAYLAWFAIVIPIQYFVYLIAGAPARIYGRSNARSYYDPDSDILVVVERGETRELPPSVFEIGYGGKQVSLTASVGAAILFVASRIA
jgi:hypothetical protein